ncbi:MAG: chitobiase/beta-hexosaminidase C-terminal domain-containing protein [Bacteroidota bacterium]
MIAHRGLALTVLMILMAAPAQAWKPTTHVYLALQTLSQVNDSQDLLGNPKPPGTIAFYRVHPQTGALLGVIGYYEADADLVASLNAHRKAFIMGVLGPDAYPDLATGQMRCHVRHPVYSDRWLQHLWDQAQGADPEITAFVLGFLTHAAGDMWMHTFVNYFAGGAWANDIQRATAHPLNFNGGRHVILEGYVGELGGVPDADDFKLQDALSPALGDFIYTHLADARAGTVLGDSVNVTKPLLNLGRADVEASLPRVFSHLRNGLQAYLDEVDGAAAAWDAQIETLFADAAAQSCPTGVTCASPPTDLTPPCAAACATAAVQAVPIETQKTAYLATHSPTYVYTQAWIGDIDTGLRAWIDLNHQLALKLLYHPDGERDLQGAKELANAYKNVHLLSMLGLPDAVGQLAVFNESMKELYLGDLQDALSLLQDNLVDVLFQAVFRMTAEEAQEMYVSPQALFDAVLPRPYQSSEGEVAVPITKATLYPRLGIAGPGEQWDEMTFEPAYNTIIMTKLMLLSRDGLRTLLTDLGIDCRTQDCLPSRSAMLGFMRSLDESRQWLPDAIYRDQPAFDRYKHRLEPSLLEDCRVFSALFRSQPGLAENPIRFGNRVVTRPCPATVALSPPVVTPPGGRFDAPQTVTITHPDPEAEVYYTLQVPGSVVEPTRPTATANDARVRRYEGPFTVAPPLDPSQLPLTLRVQAYRDGFLPSETVVHSFDVDARVATPVLQAAPGDYLETHTVEIVVPEAGPGTFIYYTLNGAAPDFNATPYTAPLRLSRGTYEVRAVAYRLGYVRSDVASATYRVYAPNEVQRAETPFFTSPRGSGTYTTAVDVALDTDTQDGVIRWTLGRDQLPTVDPSRTLGSTYTAPIRLGLGNWFLRAITIKDGLFDSEIAQINVNVVEPLGTTAAPRIDPPGGVFDNDVTVTLQASVTLPDGREQTQGVEHYYTTDGSDPDINPAYNPAVNRRYTRPFTLRRSSTVRALAYRSFFPISDLATATFEFVCAMPTVDPGPGVYYDSVAVTLASATTGATIRYTLDGSEPTEASARYEEPLTLRTTTTVRARAYRTGYTFSEVTAANVLVEASRPPVVTRQPQALDAVVGRPALLTVEADAHPTPAYQWFFGDSLLANATDDTLRLASVAFADAGAYRVILTNVAGTTTSETVLLSVRPEPVPPRITQNLPDTLLVDLGASVTFGVAVEGSPQPTYAWTRNGTLLTAQAEASITYDAATLGQAGAYRVRVQNEAGQDTSRTLHLVLNLATGVQVDQDAELPDAFMLEPNYPNPFNPSTTIPFTLPEAARVRLTLYDIAGRRIAILLNESLAPRPLYRPV